MVFGGVTWMWCFPSGVRFLYRVCGCGMWLWCIVVVWGMVVVHGWVMRLWCLPVVVGYGDGLLCVTVLQDGSV